MNENNTLLAKNGKGLPEKYGAEAQARHETERFINSFEPLNAGSMMRRTAEDDIGEPEAAAAAGAMAGTAPAGGRPEIDAPEKAIDFGIPDIPAAPQPAQAPKPEDKAAQVAAIAERAQAAAKAAAGKPAGDAAQASRPSQAAAKAPQAAAKAPQAPIAPGRIKTSVKPDEAASAYTAMFASHFGLELSMGLCYENARKLCEPDAKDPMKTLYFLENTYRLSTLLYLSGNLPVLVIATILAEKNRKNVLRYVASEVENGAKPYDELRKLRMSRWARKYEDMRPNDAMTVTVGATAMTPELRDAVAKRFADICSKMRKYNRDLAKAVAKLDDEARNDVSYIYSNAWYLLQGFENVPEIRAYLMAITDDTRKNLKI